MIYTAIPSHLHELPIYRKAIEIFSLARKISTYIIYDLSALKPDGKENESIYFTGDIVQQSESLVPEIIKAEIELFKENKYKHVDTLKHLTKLLHKNCSRLEQSSSNGKDFIPMLRKELKMFQKMQRKWILTL